MNSFIHSFIVQENLNKQNKVDVFYGTELLHIRFDPKWVFKKDQER